MPVTWAVDRGSGPDGVGVDVVVPAASTVKVLVAVAFWRRALDGALDPTEIVGDVPVVGDGSVLDRLPGASLTLGHLATLMLAVSDNAATNVLLGRLGFAALDTQARALGLRATRVRRLMLDWDAAAAGRENTTSAGDLARLMRALAEPRLVPRPVAWRVLDALRASEHRDLVGEVVPEDAVLGLKRGWSEAANHDCALLATPSGPVGLAVCSSPPAAPEALRAAVREALGAATPGPGRASRTCDGAAPCLRWEA